MKPPCCPQGEPCSAPHPTPLAIAHDAARRRCLRLLGGAGAAGLLAGLPGPGAAQALAVVRERGTLRVAVYLGMPPFHDHGRGIDVDLANALAAALGVRATLMPFAADDDMGADLRNMVWKGHYLGYGPADVLLHVPVDAPLMEANPQVRILAPYWRDRVMIARRLDRVPRLDSLAQLTGQPVAVAGQSLAGWLMIGADGGAYRAQLATQCKDGVEAAAALKRGDVAAAAGLCSELESVLADDDRFAITALPAPRAPRDGWAVGMAVKKDAVELATALQKAVDGLCADGQMNGIFARAHVRWRPA